jgi:hypothetical protein
LLGRLLHSSCLKLAGKYHDGRQESIRRDACGFFAMPFALC